MTIVANWWGGIASNEIAVHVIRILGVVRFQLCVKWVYLNLLNLLKVWSVTSNCGYAENMIRGLDGL